MTFLSESDIAQLQALLLIGFLVFLRAGAAAAILPAFGERVVPVRVRLVLGLAFTLVIAPGAAIYFPADPQMPPLGLMIATETIVGLSLGAVLRLFVFALQMCGSMAAQATSLAQIFGGQAADPLPAIGHIMVMGGLALAAITGLHVKLVMFFLLSYEIFPPGSFPSGADLMPWGLEKTAQAFETAFSLAAPFVIAALIYNVALGVINKAMPQLMVAFVGAPAITAGGLMLLAFALPMILSIWLGRFDSFLENPLGHPG